VRVISALLACDDVDVSLSNVYLTPPSSGATGADDADADYPPLTAPVAPIGASIAPFKASKTPPVLFYEKNAPFYEFTNFSPHDIMYKGKRYPTSEHLFQSFKVCCTVGWDACYRALKLPLRVVLRPSPI
jgi:hypothetical protein